MSDKLQLLYIFSFFELILKWGYKLWITSTNSQSYPTPTESWGPQSSLAPPYRLVLLGLLWINIIQRYWYNGAYHFIYVLFFCSAFILLMSFHLLCSFILDICLYSSSGLLYLCSSLVLPLLLILLFFHYLVFGLCILSVMFFSISYLDHSYTLVEFSLSSAQSH